MIDLYNTAIVFLQEFSNLGRLIVDIMFIDIFGYPLIYFAFGTGLIYFIVVKITAELLT